MIENFDSVNNTLKEKNPTQSPKERSFPSTKHRVSVGSIPSKSKSENDQILEFRCPQCYKLYRSNTQSIQSNQPQFECHSCHAQFIFDYPPKNPKTIYTRALSLPQVGKLSRLDTQALMKKGPELKTCPKCSTMNPRGVKECYKCGVIFAKLEMGPGDVRQGQLPSLIRMWQELLHDYNNITKHMAFVDRCEELQALPFALKKYKELKEVQPQDSLAHQMLNSVLVKSLSRQAGQMVEHRSLSFLKKIPYANLSRVAPIFLGFLSILIGLFGHGSRNFAGGGVAFLVLVFGFVYFSKGRISLQDFWK